MDASSRADGDDLLYAPAMEQAAAIRAGHVSSVELTQAQLQRQDAILGLNAVVVRAAEAALKDALRADGELAGGQIRGPLHGVPFTAKDSLDTRALVTTWGTIGRRDHVPDRDAAVIARLRSAGAILTGKTNTPELTLSFITDNDVYGLTSNPWDSSRSAGGSSGGAAVAVASAASAFEIGSDLGGSIRVPAHFCGIAGLKPTAGRVPRTGHALPWGGPLDAFGTIGPMARHSSDLLPLLNIIQGPDGLDPSVSRQTSATSSRTSAMLSAISARQGRSELQVARVGIYTGKTLQPPTPSIAGTLARAGEALEAQGAYVDEVEIPALKEAWDLTSALFSVAAGPVVTSILRRAGTAQASRFLTGHASWSDGWSAEQLVALLHRIDACRSRLRAIFGQWDALLMPVAAWTAPTHEEAETLDYAYNYPHNLSGCPAVVVRAGTCDRGLPIGVQIVTNVWCEPLAVRLAETIEDALGGYARPTPVTKDP
ncbi:MAG: amidase [Myxococcota bacterium]|jgi:amidase